MQRVKTEKVLTFSRLTVHGLGRKVCWHLSTSFKPEISTVSQLLTVLQNSAEVMLQCYIRNCIILRKKVRNHNANFLATLQFYFPTRVVCVLIATS